MRFSPGCHCCECDPVAEWAGPGWYCVDLYGFGNCLPKLLIEADRCKDWSICSGPYASEAAALVDCPIGTGAPPATRHWSYGYSETIGFPNGFTSYTFTLGAPSFVTNDVVFICISARHGQANDPSLALQIQPPAPFHEEHYFATYFDDSIPTSSSNVLFGYVILPATLPASYTFNILGGLSVHWEAYVMMGRPMLGFASLMNEYPVRTGTMRGPALPIPDNAMNFAFVFSSTHVTLFALPPAMSRILGGDNRQPLAVLGCFDNNLNLGGPGAAPPQTPERVFVFSPPGTTPGMAFSLAIF